MTTVQTRAQEIFEKEGFNIEVCDVNGNPVNPRANGIIGKWPYERKTKSSKTVKDFQDKFSQAYGGYNARVLVDDGTEAHGNTLLSNVRGSYEE